MGGAGPPDPHCGVPLDGVRRLGAIQRPADRLPGPVCVDGRRVPAAVAREVHTEIRETRQKRVHAGRTINVCKFGPFSGVWL